MPEALSNALASIAEDIRATIAASEQAERNAAALALHAGKVLCEAKGSCKHGQWLPFIERAGLSERSAQRWMQLHRAGFKSDTVSLLGLATGMKHAACALRMMPSPGMATEAWGGDADGWGLFYWWSDGDFVRYAEFQLLREECWAIEPTRLLPPWMLVVLHREQPTRFANYSERQIPLVDAKQALNGLGIDHA